MTGPPSGTTGNIVSGVLTPVLAKHSKSSSLLDSISIGVDRTQPRWAPAGSISPVPTELHNGHVVPIIICGQRN